MKRFCDFMAGATCGMSLMLMDEKKYGLVAACGSLSVLYLLAGWALGNAAKSEER
jgi:hypothetical protein